MTAVLLEYIFSVFDIVILTSFIDIFLKKKDIKIFQQLLLCIIAALLVFVCSFDDVFSYVSAVLITFISFMFINVLYEGNIYKKILLSVLFQFLYSIYSVIMVAGFSMLSSSLASFLYQYDSPIRTGFVIFTRGFVYIILLVLNKRNQEENPIFLYSNHLFYIILTCASIVFVIINMLVNKSFQLTHDTYLLLAGLIALFAFSIYMEKRLFENKLKIKQLESQAEAMKLQSVFNEANKQNDLEIRRTKHDLKNNLITLEMLLKDKKYKEAETYLNNLTKLPALNKIISTGNDALDALLNINIQMNPDIKFLVDIQLSDCIVEEPSMAIIVGNALSNAIEAVNKVENKKEIEIKIKGDDKKIVMVFINYYLEEPKMDNGIFMTTKEDKENHGIGIYSIRKEVEKYNGKVTIDINKEDRTFQMKLLMLKKSKKQQNSHEL